MTRYLERQLLVLYSKRTESGLKELKESTVVIFEELLSCGYDMNSVCSGGQLFCFILDMKPLLSVKVIHLMLEGGLTFKNQRGVHKKMFSELELNYSDTLWSIFILLCQNSNFVETIPFEDMFDLWTVVNQATMNMLLAYGIKKVFLIPRNFSIRHRVKSKYPLIFNAIINS